MDEILLKKFLSLINNSRPVEDLINEGYTYYHLADVTINAQKENFVIIENKRFMLTQKGTDFLNKKEEFKPIAPLNDYKIPKIGLEDIYIPNIIGED